jgi:hypothetical protein
MKSYKSFASLVQALQTTLWVTIIFFMVKDGTPTAEASVGGRPTQASSVSIPAGIWQIFTCERSADWCWIAAVDPGLVCTARKSLQQARRTFRAVARIVPNLTWGNSLTIPANWISRLDCAGSTRSWHVRLTGVRVAAIRPIQG